MHKHETVIKLADQSAMNNVFGVVHDVVLLHIPLYLSCNNVVAGTSAHMRGAFHSTCKVTAQARN